MNFSLIDIKTNRNNDLSFGALSVFETGSDIPFEIKRVYYIHGVRKDVDRGFHAHKKTRQLLICLSGSIRISMDDGKNQEDIVLDSPSKALIVEPQFWHSMHWLEDDSILLVAASEKYDENDYIRSYEDFIRHVKG